MSVLFNLLACNFDKDGLIVKVHMEQVVEVH